MNKPKSTITKVNLGVRGNEMASECFATTELHRFCSVPPNFRDAQVYTFLPNEPVGHLEELSLKWEVWSKLDLKNRQEGMDRSYWRTLEHFERTHLRGKKTVCVLDDALYANLIFGLSSGQPLVPALNRFYLYGPKTNAIDVLDEVVNHCCSFDMGGGLTGEVTNDLRMRLGFEYLRIRPRSFIFSIFDHEHIAIAEGL